MIEIGTRILYTYFTEDCDDTHPLDENIGVVTSKFSDNENGWYVRWGDGMVTPEIIPYEDKDFKVEVYDG